MRKDFLSANKRQETQDCDTLSLYVKKHSQMERQKLQGASVTERLTTSYMTSYCRSLRKWQYFPQKKEGWRTRKSRNRQASKGKQTSLSTGADVITLYSKGHEDLKNRVLREDFLYERHILQSVVITTIGYHSTESQVTRDSRNRPKYAWDLGLPKS